MKKLRSFGNIQKRILFVTLSCILGMCLIISYTSYYIFQNYLLQSMMQSTETSLLFLSDTLDNSLNDVCRMAQFCQNNSNIASYIENNPNPGSVLAVNTYDRMLEEYNSNASKLYMPRVAVITNEHFLQICTNSTYSTTADLAAEVPKLPYFDTLLSDSDYNFSVGIIADPFLRTSRMVLPIIRPITYKFNAVQGGYLFIEVSADLFTSSFKHYSLAEDSYLYLTLCEHHYIWKDGALTELSAPYEITDDLTDSALTPQALIYQVKAEDTERIIISTPLNMPGCYISQSVSASELSGQRMLFMKMIGATLIGIMAIGGLLMLIMNRTIHTPLTRLRDKIQRIAEGDFSREPAIEWNHELGEIGRGINNLSESVTLLMDKRIEDEKQKRDLEYRMLQSQINPHFIYNTLNSIKWMATIQGANGISEMTTALSRLLKSISKSKQLLIPIREELSFLKDYFTIQNYRYGGTITFLLQVDDASIYDKEIVRFTLQPLVENAIFHGIEPKGGTGHITVHACYETAAEAPVRNIRIDVTDDGVGMSPQKAAQILLDNNDNKADFFREIGVSNVHKRLQYEFGEAYGITIASAVGEFTTMTIRIPESQNLPISAKEQD